MCKRMRVRWIDVALCLALAAVWAFLTVPATVLAKKPNKPGGGGGGYIALDVTLVDGYSIRSDGGGVYSDGVEKVMAIASTNGGCRFDTTGNEKIIDRKMVRYVLFDFPAPDPAGFWDTPDFPAGTEPGVDARFSSETDAMGTPLETGWLNLTQMTPGETRYAQYMINLGFKNSDGDEEKWQLAYATPQGLDPETELPFYGLPVEVVGGADTSGDGLSDSWTVTGDVAGMRRLRVGRTWNPIYVGEAFMPFVIVLERR